MRRQLQIMLLIFYNLQILLWRCVRMTIFKHFFELLIWNLLHLLLLFYFTLTKVLHIIYLVLIECTLCLKLFLLWTSFESFNEKWGKGVFAYLALHLVVWLVLGKLGEGVRSYVAELAVTICLVLLSYVVLRMFRLHLVSLVKVHWNYYAWVWFSNF